MKSRTMRANLKPSANERRSLHAHVDAKECHRVAGDVTASMINRALGQWGTLAGQFLVFAAAWNLPRG